MLSIRPCHDLALVRPRPDLHAELFGIDIPVGGLIGPDGKQLRFSCPISYRVTAKRDEFAIGEVVGLGQGTPYGSGRDRPEVAVGTIVGFDLGQVGHVLPNGLYTLMWKAMLCTVPPRGSLPQPLASWVMTLADETAASRIALSGDVALHLPGGGRNGIATNDVRKTRVRLHAERVAAVGNGEFVRKAFIEPGCGVGDIACFTPGATVHFTWPDGRRLAFTPWSEIVCVLTSS